MSRFQDLSAITSADIEAAVRRNDPDELPLVPITAALLCSEPSAAADACERLAGHADPDVRANALASLGHIARRFRHLDERRFKPLIEAGLRDRDAGVRAHSKSAADEIHQFLHWAIAGHVYG